jgi:hypothetical protein
VRENHPATEHSVKAEAYLLCAVLAAGAAIVLLLAIAELRRQRRIVRAVEDNFLHQRKAMRR